MSEQEFNLDHVPFPFSERFTKECPICKRQNEWDSFRKRYICECGLIDIFKEPYMLGIITFGGKKPDD